MADQSKIEWTDATWNPVRGCTRVSPGCDNCYAIQVASRYPWGKGLTRERVRLGVLDWSGRVDTLQEKLDEPLHWKRPRRVFVCSGADLFHHKVPDAFLDDVFLRMLLASRHTFQCLTKRIDRAADYLEVAPIRLRALAQRRGYGVEWRWPFRNVHIGTSVENQETANQRLPDLLRCSAWVRFLSCEPLLGPLDLTEWIGHPLARCIAHHERTEHLCGGGGPLVDCSECDFAVEWDDDGRTLTPTVDWVIAGGESGTSARSCDTAWLQTLADDCEHAQIPFFLKQLGRRSIHAGVRLDKTVPRWHKKGADPEQWPSGLTRRREYPVEGC